MKSFGFIFLTLLSVVTSLSGQNNKLVFGLEAGPNVTFLRGNDIIRNNSQPTLRYTGALVCQYSFSKTFALRLGLGFERKGSDMVGDMLDVNGNYIGDFSIKQNFDYLQIPLLVRVGLGIKKRFFINIGPYFGYLFGQTLTSSSSNFGTSTINNTHLYKPLELGITSGGGVTLPLNDKISISCELRNNVGLNNIAKTPIYNNGKLKTNTTGLLLGIVFQH